MKKINNISSKIFKILGILKLIPPILAILLVLIQKSLSLFTFIINLVQNTYTILQTIMFFIAFIMIINCISTKSKAWKYYLLTISIPILEYFMPPLNIIIILLYLYTWYLYYYAGMGIKYILNQENTTINLSKKISTINYVYISIILAIFMVSKTNKIILNFTKKTEEYNIKQIIPEPIQKESTGTRIIKINDKKYTINFVADYTLIGKVVNTHSYFGNYIFNQLSPLDVGIIWGESELKKNYKNSTYFSLGTRHLNAYCKNNSSCQNHEISNNHLIPENKKIKKEMSLIKLGDYIKIEGYLINITGDDFYQNSSTTRDDTGDGACETIYVTNITWLTDKKRK